MLQILIIGNDTSGSLVLHNGSYVGTIRRFRKKLSDRVVGVLDILRKSNVSGLKYDKQQGLVLSKDGQGYLCDLSLVPSILAKEDVQPLIDTISLLHWYLEPHIHYPHPGGIYGAEPICRDCGYSQLMYDDDKCSSPVCPSHKKWAEVIDGYEPPAHLFGRAFIVLPNIESHVGLPTRAESEALVKDMELDV